MANPRIRAASLFLDGKKVGTCEGTDYSYDSGDEPQFGDPGYIGHSDGADTTTLSANSIIPVKGMGHLIFEGMAAKRDFEISLALIDGKIHEVTMRCTQSKVTNSHKNGTQMGSFNFVGGPPKIIG